MATSAPSELISSGTTTTTPQNITNANRPQEEFPRSTPVEMSSLGAAPAATENDQQPPLPPAPAIPTQEASATPDTVAPLKATSSQPETIPPVSRTYSTAIGPSSDSPMPVPAQDEASGPTLLITLLLTTGARHPFKLDSKYMAKRNVDVQGGDPFNLSVYKLKELILREWRDEWEMKPVSPSYIRLISFGKLLDDKAYLKDSRFNHDTPNVVHMTIKPQDYIEEDDAKGGKGSFGAGGDGTGRSPGCRCLVM